MNVTVGSKNPVKVASVKLAFKALWPDETWQVEGTDVVSGVSDQPMSDAESIQGATNRAERALTTGNADYGVGLEGGLQKLGDYWFDCGWIVVMRKDGVKGIGSTARAHVPSRMMKLVHGGMEMGAVDDAIFGGTNTKQAQGHFGLMTNNVVTRTGAFRDGVVMALVPFVHPSLFEADTDLQS